MNRRTIWILVTLCLLLSLSRSARADARDQKNVLIVVEGSSSLKNYAIGDGRQLATLLGHFNTRCTIKGVSEYVPGEVGGYEITFYVGFHARNTVPAGFLNDVLSAGRKTVWLNTGFAEFSSTHPVATRFGFSVSQVDSNAVFDIVRFGNRTFTKGEPNINIINIANRKQVTVIATAQSTRKRREVPYIVASGNLTYVADSPFASATETDRYLLFADLLHDILGEQHEESHSAILRIEDVSPLDDPDRLRDIADILSNRGVPFLVSVIPFYVDPGQGLRISLSDKPDLVDALKYMVHNGGTITMHGVTHQHKGITAADFEFWDESTSKPIKDETADAIARKLDLGIQEFMKNGLYPLAWETPHYTGSFLLYQTVAQFFSTAVEQRLSIEDVDYSQFFPYLIQKDLFGQRIYPENLGYIPFDPDKRTSEGYVQNILKGARANLSVRDGFASCFFHSFLDLDLLKQIVDGVQSLGYTYVDLTEHANWVQTRDRVIVTGSHSFTVALQDQFLSESYFDNRGELLKRTISEQRIRGSVRREVEVQPGQIYRAEPTEFRDREVGFLDKILAKVNSVLQSIVSPEADWQEARTVILWNHYAKGAAYNDQASLAAVFGTVNLPVDTIFLGQELRFREYNLLIVPYAFVDSLRPSDYDAILKYVTDGGHVITDRKNDLAEELGVRFSPAQLRLRAVRDRYFPEEPITWRYYELMNKLDVDNADEILCQDASSDAPVVIGKQVGKGKLLFFGTRFDPYSQHGYSHYPYLLEYVRRYFRLGPIIRRENLETYFDPGFRTTFSIEELVKQWVRVGIRRVHVAGWHEYPKYTYDYARLIRLAHANGILVYAWLEPPQVSQKFWLEHPEWREKNYRGADARPSWRYPVALTDSACLRQMIATYRKLLERFDWDGVNLAELYFEADKGFETPPQFTPMHPSAVREVRKKFGFELPSIFDANSPAYWKSNPAIKHQVTEYRIAKLAEVYERLLTEFTQIAEGKEGFQIIVTAMDSYGSPELREQIGVDMHQILALRKRFDFLLQVEDPEHLWSTDPLRYVQIGERYEQLIGDRTKLLLDLNILSFRRKSEITPFPTLIQTGTESYLLINAASTGAPRLTFYAESSVNPQDLPYFANAAATDVVYRRTPGGYEVEAERSFVLKLPKETRQVLIDGMVVTPVRDGLYVLPAGKHLVNVGAGSVGSFSTSQLQPRLISSTATIRTLSYRMRDVRFSYEADERVLVSFSNEPTQITLDGQPHSVTALKGNDCFTILLPAGTHEVQVVTGDTFTYGINVTSLWSTTAIAIFGLVAVLILLAMYIGLKFVRRRFISPQRPG